MTRTDYAKRFLVGLSSLLSVVGCSSDPTQKAQSPQRGVLRLAATTSARDSGLLDELIPVFEKRHGVRVDVIAVGTGAALKLGEAGDVDVVLVHAPDAEDAFMAAGHGVRREHVMYNTFEILGPVADPAGVRGKEPVTALARIADAQCRFVSRGDDSGTHKREVKLWDLGAGRPEWDGYLESGQGMGATLTMADQLNAYVLADRGTYLRFKGRIELVPLLVSDDQLRNRYSVLAVHPSKHPRVNGKLADLFVNFLIEPGTQEQIAKHKLHGEQLFYPLRLPSSD